MASDSAEEFVAPLVRLSNVVVFSAAIPDQGGTNHKLQIDRIDWVEGNYFINPGIFSTDWAEMYDFQWHHYPLVVKSARPHKGLFQPPMRWHIEDNRSDFHESGEKL